MIDEKALNAAWENIPNYDVELNHLRLSIETYLSHLPKPSSPYEQAIMYRKLVEME